MVVSYGMGARVCGVLSWVDTVRDSRGATGRRLSWTCSPLALASFFFSALDLTRLRKSAGEARLVERQ